MMKTKIYNRNFLSSLRNRRDITVTQHNLNYENESHKFLRIVSKKIRPDDKVVLISAGMHGEELAGPITLQKYLNCILDYIHARNFRVIIYPNMNPSGFEMGVRYNPEGERGEVGIDPNDFMRYVLKDGTVTSDLKDSNRFRKWRWSSDSKFDVILPPETKLLHCLLKRDPLRQVVAAIDLHQDFITFNASPAAYQYLYDDSRVYAEILQKIEAIVPLMSNTYIDAGYLNGGLRSDAYGSLIRYDGTLSDLMQRMGVRYTVTVETTGATPLDKACEVNLAWIKGITDLIYKDSN